MKKPNNGRNSLCVEIGNTSLKVLMGERGLELPLERRENGRLTPSCQEQIQTGLKDFLRAEVAAPSQAFVAIGARGVSMRKLAVPPASKETLAQLLHLQIEKEFPLHPDQLAWGYLNLGREGAPGSKESSQQELLVFALRKEWIEDYTSIFSACNLHPEFTVGIVAAGFSCPDSSGTFAWLDIGRIHSELITFDRGFPASLRIFSWGGETLTRSIQESLNVGTEEAERLKVAFSEGTIPEQEQKDAIAAVVDTVFQSWAAELADCRKGKKLYLAGKTARLLDSDQGFAEAFGGGMDQRSTGLPALSGFSAVTQALKRYCDEDEGAQLFFLNSGETSTRGKPAAAWEPWKWAALACLLVFLSILLRYAEPLFKMPGLSRRIDQIEAAQAKLPPIGRELEFLKYIETNQPPYLDALTLLADATPRGAKFESMALNQRGEVSLRGVLQNSQQAGEFRSKLIASGFFSSVVVEEQTPGPNNQNVQVRITALWKPVDSRPPLPEDLLTTPPNPSQRPGSPPHGVPLVNGGPPPVLLR